MTNPPIVNTNFIEDCIEVDKTIKGKYDLSDVLVDNYDFLVYCAMDYILKYYETYQDKIIIGEEYNYFNKNLESKSTDLYISLEDIYMITDKFFGVRDFEIINNDVVVYDGYVSLIDYSDDKFPLHLNSVEVVIKDEFILAYVYYENDSCYIYTFINDNMILKLRNIEVLS